MKRLFIIFLFAIFGLFVIQLLYSTSFIQITVTSGGGSKSSVVLLNQRTGKTKTVNSDSKTFKTRLPRGNYEVTVSGSDNSYVQVVSARGFLRTVDVTATLQPQKSRKFVGYNPGDCAGYDAGLLATYSCGDVYGNLGIHNPPADSNTPTNITKPVGSGGISGYLRGFVNTSEGLLALIQHPSGEDVEQYYSINLIGAGYVSKSEILLPDLSSSETYSIKPYSQGFIVFNSKLSNVLYYSSASGKPQKLTISNPGQSGLLPAALDVSGDVVTALFSTSEDTPDKNASSAFVIRSGSDSKTIKVNKYYSDAVVCATQKLCALGRSNKLDIYDVSSGSAKLQYSLSDIRDMHFTQNGFMTVNSTGIVNMDVVKRNGYQEYSFGGYKYHSVTWIPGGYIVAVDDNSSRRTALFVDQTATNKDSIDKKILSLEGLTALKSVSVYGGYIFVSPDAGELVYDAAIRSYSYDPAKLASATSVINTEIDKLGINRQTYTIINTLQQ